MLQHGGTAQLVPCKGRMRKTTQLELRQSTNGLERNCALSLAFRRKCKKANLTGFQKTGSPPGTTPLCGALSGWCFGTCGSVWPPTNRPRGRSVGTWRKCEGASPPRGVNDAVVISLISMFARMQDVRILIVDLLHC